LLCERQTAAEAGDVYGVLSCQ